MSDLDRINRVEGYINHADIDYYNGDEEQFLSDIVDDEAQDMDASFKSETEYLEFCDNLREQIFVFEVGNLFVARWV